MAAAGLGNIVSDIAGLGFADVIEVTPLSLTAPCLQDLHYLSHIPQKPWCHMPCCTVIVAGNAQSLHSHRVPLPSSCFLSIQAQARKLSWCREPPLSNIQKSMYSTRGEVLSSASISCWIAPTAAVHRWREAHTDVPGCSMQSGGFCGGHYCWRAFGPFAAPLDTQPECLTSRGAACCGRVKLCADVRYEFLRVVQ